MTKKSIRNNFIAAIIAFCLLLLVGIAISILDTTERRVVFTTFKDLLPLPLGIAAAWLGYSVQRRSAYQQQLRTLWSKLVEAVNCAIQLTHLAPPNQEQHDSVLTKLSIAIDEVRGVFCNLDETETEGGLYPFEPIKDIHRLVADLGYGAGFKTQDADGCRQKVFALWKDVRKELLKEFDREEPTFPHSHWADIQKSRVYEEHEIEKRPT